MRVTPVSKNLDKKLKILGFEVPDLLVIFLTIGILNFLVKDGSAKILYVWGPAVVLALAVRIFKRNKPDNFLVHWLRYHLLPEGLQAFPAPKKQNYSFKEKDCE